MSLQKVVSNYYVDLLDYLGSKYRKYNGNFDTYFSNLNPDGRRQLINKIASVFQRIDILRKSQTAYWKNRLKTQNSYYIIMIIMIFIVALILLYMLAVDLNSGTIITMYQKTTTVLMYFIIYMVIFTLLILIILNIHEGMKQTAARELESTTDINNLQKLFDVDSSLRVVLMFIGYKSTEQRLTYGEIYNANKSLIEKYIIKGQKVVSKSNKKDVLGEVDVFNYDLFFTDKFLTGDTASRALPIAIKNFYNNGEGYTTVRKEVIGSSNILILKELRRIMEYYYKLIKRKDNAGILTDDKKVKDILNKYVVKEFMVINKALAPLSANAYTEITPPNDEELIYQAERDVAITSQNSDFLVAYTNLITMFTSIILYSYQIFAKMPAGNSSFDPSLRYLMPQNADLQTMPGDTEFNTTMKQAFATHYKDKLLEYIEDAKKTSSQDAIYMKVFKDFNDQIDAVYQSVLIHVSGDYYFPVSTTYMSKMLDEVKLKETLGNLSMDKTYTSNIIGVLTRQYMPEYWKGYKEKFKDVEERKAALTGRITVSMAKFENIRLMEHQEYIKNQLGASVTPEVEPTLIEIFGMVDRNVKSKKLSETAQFGRKSDDARFLEIDQFVDELDKVTYVDLKVGLNLDFYGDILDRFFFSVNNSIYNRAGAGDRSTKDIYFVMNKRMKLASVALNFAIVIIVLCLLYHIITVSHKFKIYTLAKAERFSDDSIKKMDVSDKLTIKKEYREKYLNLWMQACIPVAFAIFFICLLQSVFKKSQAKAKFNKETIDTNTSELRGSLQDLRILFEDLDGKITLGQRNNAIKKLAQLNVEEKTTLYAKLKAVVDKFEKCNYVLESGKNDIPFPYTEVIIDGFMVAVIVLCIFWVLGEIGPVQRIREIKLLNKIKEKGETASTSYSWGSEMITKAKCHDSEIDSIMFTLKIMFFIFIVMFLIFYATKVLTSTSEYEFGIYNSMYFEESICLD